VKASDRQSAEGRGAVNRLPLKPNAFGAVLARELRLALRHKADTLAAVMFFVLVSALFPFGIGPAPEILARIAPGALLASALLAALLPLDRLFGAEAEDGSLEQLLLSGLPPSALAGAKALGHWLTTGLPLLVATPMAAAMLNLPVEAWGTAMLALGLATGVLSLFGTAGAALTLGARRGGVLLPLLVLPLSIPAVIFGAAAIEAAASGLTARPYLLLLAALLAAAAPLAPLAAGAALRAE
jgi:heme exporter protein B